LYEDPKELQIMKPYPPLGILYICAHLRSKGMDVEVFDSTFSTQKQLLHALQSSPPSVLGVYANLMTRTNVIEVLRAARNAGWKTIVGGPEPGAYIQNYLDAGADFVIIGEGEVTLEELLPVLHRKSNRPLEQIAGIAFRSSDGSIVQTNSREQIRDINAQPWPAREAIDMDRYISTWREHHGTGSVSLITARGCPYHCRWCSHQVFGKTHRRRTPASVADELAWLVERYHPDIAWMADDVFTIHHGWLFQYAEELKKRNLRVPFECISRADRLNPRVVATLAEIGCFRVWIGSESGPQRILDAMERGVTVEEVQTAVTLCRSSGIQTGMFLMWGYEGEELDDVEATIQHVKKTDPDIFFTTVAYPIQGTPYSAEVADRTEHLKDWQAGSDRDVRIRGRHSRNFYGIADQLLRGEVELERTRKKTSVEASLIAQLRDKVTDLRTGLHASSYEVEA
jgi:radical SAM superfamily enzyme YgiQ (UPF0313 family)